METLEDGTINEIKKFFPLVGKKQTLVAKDIYVGDPLDLDDIASQKKARLRGRTWAQGIFGDFNLVDNETGKVVDSSKKLKILNLPKITRRYSYIVDGTEYQADNQWRLKSGVYARRKANGELESQFNLAEGRGFRMGFDPLKRRFLMSYGSSNIQLLPVLQALGIRDENIQKAWGKELYASALATKKRGELVKLAKVLNKTAGAKTDSEAVPVIQEVLEKTKLREDTTKITLGASFKSVTGGALLATSQKLLNINKGVAEVDNRDALQFKELWSINDHIPERIENSKRRITYKMTNNLDRRDNVRSIVTADIFNVPVKAFFTSTSLSQQTSQVNPVDMVGGFLRTTIMGTGGIQSDAAISDEAKLIDSSYLGFIDPVHTPEGKRSGISGHLSLGVRKKGTTPLIRVYDVKAGKYADKSPSDLTLGNVAFSDQYDFSSKKPTPKEDSTVVIPSGGGDPNRVPTSEVDYVLQSPKQMFSITANLVPFLPSDQANRAGMATRHIEQSISLKNAEQPLVQVVSGNSDPNYATWEKIVGRFTSHPSPASGFVDSVSASKIVVKDKNGKKHDIQLYDNFPLNDKKAFISSNTLVKKGDKVSTGQIIADTNFTRGGTLALGTNLRVGYLPYKGLVFEDGIVISESASKKLTSNHLHKERSYVDKNMVVGLKKFRAHYPGIISEENVSKMDADGVVKKGQIVDPGDTLITVLQKSEPSKEQLLLKGIHKSLVKPFKNKSLMWDKPHRGVVTDVVRNGREILVYVKTEEDADIGDKLSGRHGNKGVITAVIPDEEMPKDKDGNALQIVLSPSGIPGRINPGQVLETSLGNVAYSQGEPYAVENFQSDDAKKIVKVSAHTRTIQTKTGPKVIQVKGHERELGYQDVVASALKNADLSETRELFDPQTGKSLGKILVGHQYFLKLMHQVDKKLSARSHGYGYDYDANLVPKSGGKSGGAQRFGELGLYAMLAHGATANIRDALTYKGDKQQDEIWTAIQTGSILPAPKPSFAYEKFLAYMRALGLNVEKEGNGLVVSPLTDKQIVEMSNGEIKDGSRVIRGKDLKPEKDGLFDETITGGPGGKNWSHIRLSESLPNPVFEKGIRSLLGLTGKEYDAIVGGKLGFNAEGEVVAAGDGVATGPSALAERLKSVDLAKELADAKEAIKTAKRTDLDKVNKKIKYTLMLQNNELSAAEAYVLDNVPILPPLFRPITAMEGGDLNIDGVNMLYRDIALLNQKLKEAKGVLPDSEIMKLREDLYSAAEALMGVQTMMQGGLTTDGQPRPPGILHILSGRSSPKQSYFLQRLIDRRQDISMRSVIVPDLNLHLDELGLPRKGAMKIYRPFVVRELVKMGYTPLKAREEVEKKSTLANKALDIAVSKRPVMFKRDPVLHKFGIMAFKPRLHDESAIHIHPLVVGGFNADFDGDTMAVFVPVSQEAVDESYKMMPSKNLFNPATGQVMYQPTLEGQLGLYLLTRWGKKSDKRFKNAKEAIASAKAGETSMTDVVQVGAMNTTAGRLIFNSKLPAKIQSDEFLTDPKEVLGSGRLQAVLRELATKAPTEFAPTIDKVKDLGFGHAYNIGFSFSLNDFLPLREIREKHMAKARKQEAVIHKQLAMKMLSQEAADSKIVKLYFDAEKAMATEAQAVLNKSGNNLQAMKNAGVKPKWAQLKQLILSPMLVENAKGRVIPVPVSRSYVEGLKSSDYWVTTSGARSGLIKKVQEVQIPGALNKQLANTAISYIITDDDCGTSKGIALPVTDSDLVDRFTAKPIAIPGFKVSANTLITPNLLSKLKAAKVDRVIARSPLKCDKSKGLCAKCYGLFDNGSIIPKGTNIGLIAGTAIGERGTQLSMRVFHTGGVAGAGGGVVGGIDRVSQLLKMPGTLANSATLSPLTGEVKSVKESSIGGYDLMVGNQEAYVPGNLKVTVKKGSKVRKGQPLSTGVINPHDLLEKTNIETVQRYLADEIHQVYANEGIKKRNVEVVTKALTNLGRVMDSGDSDKFIRGDYISLSHAGSLNKTLKNPIAVLPVLRGVETLPLDQTTDWLARLQYRKLKETFIRAANEGWESDIHGLHPAPGLAYSAEFGRKDKTVGGPY
tara:strand:- start:5335 stop:11577 length:6243 start_codon:yes stop_codon:yes gene_type:complete